MSMVTMRPAVGPSRTVWAEIRAMPSPAMTAEGIRAAVVSAPCFELFADQDAAYRATVLGRAPRVGIEAMIRQGWGPLLGENSAFVGMSGFGASAPARALYEHFGITARAVADAAGNLVTKPRS